ncbi:MAG: alpha/beta hydrolase-fold protein [Bacteroidetes bacterium]|nr:alpha/beta hydrolase-fold protein [Bacteroidota bacterium]
MPINANHQELFVLKTRFQLNPTSLRLMGVTLLFLVSAWGAFAQPSSLSDAIRIRSEVLGYNLQYWVYTPSGYDSLEGLPVLFLSDGAWYIDPGQLPALLDKMIEKREIRPIVAVFLDARIPENTSLNRRNGQFFCNQAFIRFYKEELIPTIDKKYKTSANRMGRTTLGLSFGGLNSACFGLHANDVFYGIGMQSPATHPIRTIHSSYADSSRLPINIFLSSGDRDDNETVTRRLRDILIEKGYPLKYLEVPFAHNWDNWKPLLDDFLLHFYGSGR